MKQTKVIKTYEQGVNWESDTFWWNCPGCGERVCSGWFFQENSRCDECGAKVTIQAVVRYNRQEA